MDPQKDSRSIGTNYTWKSASDGSSIYHDSGDYRPEQSKNDHRIHPENSGQAQTLAHISEMPPSIMRLPHPFDNSMERHHQTLIPLMNTNMNNNMLNMGSGMNQGISHGMNQGMNHALNHAVNHGLNVGSNSGINSVMNLGMNSAINSGNLVDSGGSEITGSNPSYISGNAPNTVKEEAQITRPKGGGKSKAVSGTKRAAQNRVAQRAFRERREKYVRDLEQTALQVGDLQKMIDQLRQENAELRGYTIKLQGRIMELTAGDTHQLP